MRVSRSHATHISYRLKRSLKNRKRLKSMYIAGPFLKGTRIRIALIPVSVAGNGESDILPITVTLRLSSAISKASFLTLMSVDRSLITAITALFITVV